MLQTIKSHARTSPPRILIRNSHRHQPSTSLAPRDDARRSAGLRARFPARTACESTACDRESIAHDRRGKGS